MLRRKIYLSVEVALSSEINKLLLVHFNRRLSSVVEHVHGKDGVSGSNPEGGSSLRLRRAQRVGIRRLPRRSVAKPGLKLLYIITTTRQAFYFHRKISLRCKKTKDGPFFLFKNMIQHSLDDKDFAKLKQLEASLWIAKTRFDNDYMEQILAPDFFEFGRSGKIYQREETLSHEY